MKAAVVVGFNDIEYIDIEEPAVLQGQVKVKIAYCGICGSDIPRVLNGTCHSFPQVLGHEFSGMVTEVAPDVTSVAVGDHVVGVPLVPCMECEDCKSGHYSLCKHYSFVGSRQQGAMAEYVVLNEANVVKMNKEVSLKHAALVEPSSVSLHGILINSFNPKPSDKVLVIGAGTIALFAIQWCKILGAKDITVVIRSKEREEIVRKYGADKVFSSLDENYINDAIESTNGKGFNYVFDAVGTNDTVLASLKLAANLAYVCMIGTPTRPMSFTVKEWEIINRKEMHLTGSWMSYSLPFPGAEWTKTIEEMEKGNLVIEDDYIYDCIPLSKVKEAFKMYEYNRSAIKGRVILDCSK